MMMIKFLRLASLLLLLISLVGVNLSQAQPPSQPGSSDQASFAEANLPWRTEYVQQELDPPRHVGEYVSLALRPIDNYPAMSYFDATNYALMLAIAAPNHAGNCGTDNNWLCAPLDDPPSAEVGLYTSLDFWAASPASWKMGISYFDYTNRSLKAVLWNCSYLTCNRTDLTISAAKTINETIGADNSLKYNSAGVPAISYEYLNTSGVDSVRLAYPVTAGGNCGEGPAAGLWQCDIVDTGDGTGSYSTLDFSWDDTPYVAYYTGFTGQLEYAYAVPPGEGNCGTENDWQCSIIDGGSGIRVGIYNSLVAPQSPGDNIRVAYFDHTNYSLKFAYPFIGGNCGGGILQCEKIDEMGGSSQPQGISLALDNNGVPVIAYQKIAPDLPPVLRLARPYFVYGDGAYGNCGDVPPGQSHLYWRCDTLDPAGQTTSEANFVSLAVDTHGLVRVAYTEYDGLTFTMSLKTAYQTYMHTYLPFLSKP